ncbi:DnaA N-terminal domain-containing protein [Candidatus Odyssella thessalonicensis]|uniref:DnaA N-terminal domain-containing protein n=1 Tax=Candidatus Odyssella thessalonicensis TaxID=84647 RepID=UPI000225B979|nr:DnaA N-terminal domain-containing protein [Candidatus Odyssella thessalonicensis]
MNASRSSQLPLGIQPQLVRHFGANAAAFIARLDFWIKKNKFGVMHNGLRWIFNTAKEWSEQIGVSERQIRRIVLALKEAGVISIDKLAEYKSNRTNYYTLNYNRLNELFLLTNPKEVSVKAASLGQNVLMVNSEITNKDSNKSDKRIREHADTKSHTLTFQALDVEEKKSDKKGQNTPTQNMLTFWNDTFPNNQIDMNRILAPLLMAALKAKFNSDIRLWQHYCKTIESSSYLTSNGFNLSIYWALKYVTIDRIKAGEFGVKSISIPGEKELLEKSFIDEIQQLSEPDKCKEIRLKLLKVYGVHAYKSWFKALNFFFDGETVKYTAPNLFHRDFVVREYGDVLKYNYA